MTDVAAPQVPRRTAATNTTETYGWVERAFHWSLALLIPTNVMLGRIAEHAPFVTDGELARKALLFSTHKSVGLAIFLVALVRIAWALSQPRPAPLHPKRRAETLLAATVHWLLYGSLVLVPLTGWLHHVTTTGFAPIWWPFGQSLPFMPKDAALSARFAVLHQTFVVLLVLSLALHVAGAVKHAVIDRDATLARMWRGVDPGPLPRSHGTALPALAAAAVWLAALGVGFARAPEATAGATVEGASTVAAASNWTVSDGALSITVTQMGQAVTGTFADWQAAIDFAPEARLDGTYGTVEVAVATGSLTLGSVSDQATGEAFLASGAFPTAVFEAAIRPAEGGDPDYLADGTLEIRGVSVPVRLPFTLDMDGEAATVAGTVSVDRRDFGMGESYPDEASVGFGVSIDVTLTAEPAA